MKSTEYRVQSTDQISLSAKRSVSEMVCQQSGLSGEAGLPAIVGITGGIGSGKSTIARALAARGYAVYDCDKEAKRIIAENAEVQQKIIELLGEEAFTNPSAPSLERVKSSARSDCRRSSVELPGGEVSPVYNTAYVAERVFAEPELLERLNQIVHPAVKEDILQRSGPTATRSYSEAVLQAQPVLFIESAILYEAGLDEICDKIIVVEAPEEVRIERTIARDYNGEATEENINKVRARIQAQKAVSHQPSAISNLLVVNNDGKASIEELVTKITHWM